MMLPPGVKVTPELPLPVTITPPPAAPFLQPTQIIIHAEKIAVIKTQLKVHKCFLLACLSGVYLGFGATCSITFSRGIPNSDPGTVKFAFGALFPVGLILILFCGAELVTGNFAVFIPGVLNGTVKWWQVLLNWGIVYLGNFTGCLITAYFLGYMTDLFTKDPWLAGVQAIAEAKVAIPWGACYLSGVGCNWLVVLAVFMSIGANSIPGKVLVIWFPIQTFATIGFEHCVANMFMIPLGMLYGANVTFGEFIGKNLVPVTLGNMTGAIVFVALVYWYLYGIGPAGTVFDQWLANRKAKKDAEKNKKSRKGEKDLESGSGTDTGSTTTGSVTDDDSKPMSPNTNTNSTSDSESMEPNGIKMSRLPPPPSFGPRGAPPSRYDYRSPPMSGMTSSTSINNSYPSSHSHSRSRSSRSYNRNKYYLPGRKYHKHGGYSKAASFYNGSGSASGSGSGSSSTSSTSSSSSYTSTGSYSSYSR